MRREIGRPAFGTGSPLAVGGRSPQLRCGRSSLYLFILSARAGNCGDLLRSAESYAMPGAPGLFAPDQVAPLAQGTSLQLPLTARQLFDLSASSWTRF